MDETGTRGLRFAMLGPLQAWHGDAALDLGPARRQALFVALLLRADTQVSHETLLDDLWDGNVPRSGHKVLPSHIHPLRKALDVSGAGPEESVIRSGKGWYSFDSRGVRLDTAELEEQAGEARQAKLSGHTTTALDRYAKALGLFRGEPLTNLLGRRAQEERLRLLERRLALRLERLEYLLLLGRAAETMDELVALATSEPLNESVVALHMRALYAGGRQAEALNAYKDMQRRLREELGIDPGRELRRIHDAVLHQDETRLFAQAGPPPSAATAVSPLRRPINELPGDGGRLIGREAELARLIAPSTPGSVSVVTVDGTAGVGKTALIVRAAREMSTQYPDGCLFVDLRAYSTQRRQSPEQALQRLLRSLGQANSQLPDDLEELTAVWRATTSSLRLLLVLDDALDVDQVRPLLPAGAGSRMLVAGRRRLTELDAERRVTLEPLGSGHAVALLTHLIGKTRASSRPAATQQLVGLCDGLPLALRLAASRLQSRSSWSVEYLVDRMAGSDRRLGELSVGERSVESAFRLSYDHLDTEQQLGFRAVGLAPTVEFDLRTPSTMLDRQSCDTERILESLVDASLVQQPRPGRYRLHDLVRLHARRVAESLPHEAATSRAAVLDLYLDAARTTSDWGPRGFPTGPEPGGIHFANWQEAEAWLDAAGGELVDVVGHAAALGEVDNACWLAEALCDYFVRQGRYHESRTALEIALAHVDGATDERMPAALRNCSGYTALYQRQYAQARALFDEGLKLSRNLHSLHEESRALMGLGALELSLGKGDLALLHVAPAVKLATGLRSNWVVSMGNVILGLAHYFQKRNDEALACFTEASVHAEPDGRPRMMGRPLSLAADVHLRLGKYDEAQHLLRRAVDLVQQSGDIFLCARSLTRLGTAEQATGHLATAIGLHLQALQVQQTMLSPLTEPSYEWLETDIRSRLARALAAAGRVREASEQLKVVLDGYRA